VIFLCLAGGPSHLETFDPKPKLAELDGQEMPESVTAGQPIAQLQGKKLICLGPRTTFTRHGECGAEVSDFFPKLGALADSYAIVRSMVTEQINHDPAHTFMNCGTALSGRPSMGAWVTYGLGSEADDLPGFVVMTSKIGRSPRIESRIAGGDARRSGKPSAFPPTDVVEQGQGWLFPQSGRRHLVALSPAGRRRRPRTEPRPSACRSPPTRRDGRPSPRAVPRGPAPST
jgi:hypothetical protein